LSLLLRAFRVNEVLFIAPFQEGAPPQEGKQKTRRSIVSAMSKGLCVALKARGGSNLPQKELEGGAKDLELCPNVHSKLGTKCRKWRKDGKLEAG